MIALFYSLPLGAYLQPQPQPIIKQAPVRHADSSTVWSHVSPALALNKWALKTWACKADIKCCSVISGHPNNQHGANPDHSHVFDTEPQQQPNFARQAPQVASHYLVHLIAGPTLQYWSVDSQLYFWTHQMLYTI